MFGLDGACCTVDKVASGSMTTQNQNQPLQTVLTRPETAKHLRLSIRTLDYLIARGEIGFCKVGVKSLFRPSDIESFLARHEIAPRATTGDVE